MFCIAAILMLHGCRLDLDESMLTCEHLRGAERCACLQEQVSKHTATSGAASALRMVAMECYRHVNVEAAP